MNNASPALRRAKHTTQQKKKSLAKNEYAFITSREYKVHSRVEM